MGNILTQKRNGGGTSAIALDELTYNYHTTTDGLVSNRLYQVNDVVSAGNYTDDIDDQGTFNNTHSTIETANNYGYDELGNLVRDVQEEIASIEWTVYGKMKKITRNSGSTKADLEFGYDASGNRLWKKVTPKGSGALVLTYYYLRDAQGNEMCRYVKYTNTSSQLMYVAQEHSIYGSSRVGVDGRKDTLYKAGSYSLAWGGVSTSRRELGLKSFELANHLGNVLVTVSDKPIYKVSSTTICFNPEITSISDYYPFGAPINGRSYSSTEYRFGFNTQEKIDEIAGPGNHNTATFWEYDGRLGRRWNLDPKPNPSISIYSAFASNPIFYFDKNGDTTYRFNKADGKYMGMFDTKAAGQYGSYGSMKTLRIGKNKVEYWEGKGFEFADPANDSKQIQDGLINKLIFVSDAEIKGLLTSQGAFDYNNKNSYWGFFQKSLGSQPFDYSYSAIPSKYGKQGASKDPQETPSTVLFLPQGDFTAHNHMNFGNYLWAASGFTLGFEYSDLQIGGHINSMVSPRRNNYPSQLDSDDDQNSIKKGAYHASRFKYRTILELRHQAEMQKTEGQ